MKGMSLLLLGLSAALTLEAAANQPLRVNEMPGSVYRAAGDYNHAIQRTENSLQVAWIGRDRFPYPFYAEIDLGSGQVTRLLKLTEEKGRGKGLRMNPSIGRYQGQTWVAWVEELRRQRRSYFLLNLRPVGAGQPTQPAEAQEGEETAPAAQESDPRQVFELGHMLAPVRFYETSQGFSP